MIKKLMTAASVAALLTGAAHAQLKVEATAAGTVGPATIIAEEVDFAALNATPAGNGTVELEIITQGTIPPGQNLFLTIEATNATFSSPLNGAEFNGGTTGAVVNAGGAAGASSVRYLITSDGTSGPSSVPTSGNGADHVSLVLPFNMTTCGDATFAVTEFETESAGTPIEGGAATLTSATTPYPVEPLLTCDDAFQATVAVDALDSTLDFNTSFEQFVVNAPDTTTTAILGDFSLVVDTAIDIDLLGTAADPAHVLGFDADVDFADDTNILTGEALVGAGALFTVAATPVASNTIALSSTTAATTTADSGTFEVAISGAAGDPVLPQTVSVSDAELSLDTAVNLLDTDAFIAADVEDLKINGQYFGPFDWVSDSTKLVNTIFRITGFDGAEDIPAQIIVQNSRAGDSFNGVYPFTILASDVQGSEIRLNSTDIQNVAGAFGTADISIVISSALALDVDRLLAGPSNAVVVPFGDGANDAGTAVAPYGSSAPSTGNNDIGNY